MRMKKIGVAVLAVLAFASCERKREPNKILDGYTAGIVEVVVPGNAAQQYVVLKRDILRVAVSVVNRLQQENALFPELSGPSAGKYAFSSTERHYGTANFTIEFFNDTGSQIDPIAVRSSSNTLKSFILTTAAASNEFPTITETLTVVLESSGVVTSRLRMTGSSVFTGSSYSLTFNIDPSGCKTIYEALTDGSVTATGTGGTPPATATINLAFSSDHAVNGSMSWEGREAGLHIETNGSGLIVAPEGRILLD